MRKILKFPFMLLFCTFLFNILIVSSTLLLHELGHFLTGVYANCKNIKLVLFDQALGTYTEMSCPNEQPFYFSLIGAFLFTLPFSLSFKFLKIFPEKNFFWISLGFNLLISVTDISKLIFLQIIIFGIGLMSIVFGEVLLIDKLLLFLEKRL